MNAARPLPRRVSRRWFLRAAGGAAAAAATTACFGSDSKPGATALPSAAAGRTSTPSTSLGPGSTRVPSVNADRRRGGTVRYTGNVAGDGQYDPHKTLSDTFIGIQALVYSRLLNYLDQEKGDLVADLATRIPEFADGQTLIFQIKPNATWPENSPFNGRKITAGDVRMSIERQFADPSFAHRARWSAIDKIESQTETELVVRLKQPFAPILSLFADASGYIVPHEVANSAIIPSASTQPGSGPFRWVEWSERRLASVARNPTWFGGDGRPYLDGVAITHSRDATEIEAHLRTKELDVAVVGRPAADRLKKAIPELVEQTAGHAQWFGMRFYLPIAPYNDVRLRTAISIAIDRREMLDQFFAGSGELNPWISWPLRRWSLPQAELITIPGHRVREVEREADIAEARRLLAASLSDAPLPGTLELLVPQDIETSLGMGTLMQQQIKRNLDLNVTVNPQPISTIVQRLIEGTAPWAAGVDTGWLDLDDWLYPYFHTNGPKNTFPLRDPEIDSLINNQRGEYDEAYRRDVAYQVQRKLLQLNPGANFVSERVVTLSWPYVKNFPVDVAQGFQDRLASTWLDRDDPTFRGR